MLLFRNIKKTQRRMLEIIDKVKVEVYSISPLEIEYINCYKFIYKTMKTNKGFDCIWNRSSDIEYTKIAVWYANKMFDDYRNLTTSRSSYETLCFTIKQIYCNSVNYSLVQSFCTLPCGIILLITISVYLCQIKKRTSLSKYNNFFSP